MIAGALDAGAERTTSDEFMTADRQATGTTQLLALLDGHPAHCE